VIGPEELASGEGNGSESDRNENEGEYGTEFVAHAGPTFRD
jgi:hypothetical protein